MKISTRTIMRALRLYNRADDNASAKNIRQLIIEDNDDFVVATFVYDKKQYGLLYGMVIDEYSTDELWPDKPEDAEVLDNPLQEGQQTTPFQGKYLMLFYLPAQKQRLDIYLATEFDPSVSRSQWQKHIKAGHVSVNGEVVVSSKAEVGKTDSVAVAVPEAEETTHDVTVLYEDDDVVVINKPIGMLTHAKGGIVAEQTVADVLRPRTTAGLDTDRPGIVHRLDRDTSGVIIGAKHEEAAKHLQAQFAERKVEKVYLAIVDGAPKHPTAMIDVPIGRNPSAPSTFRADANGKSAETFYEVLASHGGKSLVKLSPKTGRTHQLRVHMAHIGTPITGDRVYGKTADRLLLHAYQLTLTLPNGTKKTFNAPVPEAFLSDFPEVKDTL